MRKIVNSWWRALVLTAIVATASLTRAQDTVRSRGIDASRLSLTLGCGPIYGVARDCGVSPIIYQTPGINTYCAAILDNNVWRYQIDLHLTGHILCKDAIPIEDIDVAGYGLSAHLRMGLERQTMAQEGLRLWIGAGLEDWCSIDYNNRYMNACVGMGNLVAPTLSVRGEQTMGWLTLSIAAGTAPLGWWFRPGFAYVANYTTGETEVESFTDNYACHAAALPLLTGEVGAKIALSNGNKLGVIYQWNFLTTRNSGDWKYEAAQHSVRLELSIGF